MRTSKRRHSRKKYDKLFSLILVTSPFLIYALYNKYKNYQNDQLLKKSQDIRKHAFNVKQTILQKYGIKNRYGITNRYKYDKYYNLNNDIKKLYKINETGTAYEFIYHPKDGETLEEFEKRVFKSENNFGNTRKKRRSRKH